MQKMWAIAAITLVGLMMIISSIPQDAFAGKDTVRLTLKVIITSGNPDGKLCTPTPNEGGVPIVAKNIVVKGKNGKVIFTFEDPNRSVDEIGVTCDGTVELGKASYKITGKNNKGIFDYQG